MEVHLESKPCPLGCPLDDETVLVGANRLRQFLREYAVVRCRTCSLMRTNPRPTPASIAAFYPSSYAPYVTTRVGVNERVGALRAHWRRLAARLFETNGHRLPPLRSVPGRRLLEIGCASGRYLHEMAGAGWEVHGLELDEEPARAARALGYPVLACRLEEAPDPRDPFDLIVGWHVFEHLHEPVQCLKKLHGWVRPGGWLVLSMPNAGSFEFRMFRDAWYGIDLPIHLFHYAPRTLAKVLRQGGWRLERVLHQRNINNVLLSSGLLLQKHRRLPRLARSLIESPGRSHPLRHHALYPLAWVLALLRQAGRITVWARRQEDP